MNLVNNLILLYRKISTGLPFDVEKKIKESLKNEKKGSVAYSTLKTILRNIDLARKNKLPLCQDTGTPIFFIKYGPKYRQKFIREAVIEATKLATEKIPLRPNAVDTVTGKNTKNNIAEKIPVIYFEESEKDELEVSLILKGGGSENIGTTYQLPDTGLKAGRDLNGIKKCILDAVLKAQGKGCPPMVMSVVVGSPKDLLAVEVKKQLLRKLSSKNKQGFEKLEKELTTKANSLGIGPMGFGGKTTILATLIKFSARHPASYFVEVAFFCWAARRGRMIVKGGKVRFEI